jgi:hypothetical protein
VIRALRAAGISLKMHGKFHPKPRVSLSPALPVGIESTREFLQIEAEGLEDIDRSVTRMIDSRLPRGMRILGASRGKMNGIDNDFSYLLVGRKGFDGEAEAVKEVGDRVFYLWRGKNVKELWVSGDFLRIVKIENRRINGLRADYQRNLQ